jgi:hypothetical protein
MAGIGCQRGAKRPHGRSQLAPRDLQSTEVKVRARCEWVEADGAPKMARRGGSISELLEQDAEIDMGCGPPRIEIDCTLESERSLGESALRGEVAADLVLDPCTTQP